MRAMSRRTWRTRAVFSSWPLAFWKRRLNASFLRAISSPFSWSGVFARRSSIFMTSVSFAQARDKARLHRQLGGRQLEGLLRDAARHAVDLEHDPPRMDAADPVFGRALAAAHAHLGRLAGDRHVREDADPDATDTLQVASHGAPRRLDLARGNAARFDGLQAEGAEIERVAALGRTVDAALVGLPVLGSLRLQHSVPSSDPRRRALARDLLLLRALVLRHRVVRQDLALENPDLDAASAVGRLGRRPSVVDVGAQRMQRHTPLAVPLHARDLGAAQAPAAVDADAARPQPHGRLHGPLHRPPEGDATLQLLRDVLRYQLGVDLRLADLEDVEMHLAAGHLLQVVAQLLDVGALLADDDAGARRVNGDARLLGRPLDDDAADAGLRQALLQIVPQTQVLVQHAGIVLVGVPARIPGAVDADAQADRIDLLTHLLALLALADDHGQVAPGLQDPGAASARPRMEALHDEAATDRRLGHVEAIDVELMVVLGIGDRRLQHALHRSGDAALRERQFRQRRSGVLAADEFGDEVELARAAAQQARDRLRLVVRLAARCLLLAHFVSTFLAFLSAAVWPWNTRVGENSPKRWPIMFSVTSTGRNLWPL